MVEEGRLRFDFTHPYGVKPEEMQKIENRLSEFIRRKDQVSVKVLPIEEAKKKGALAFFAEKYGKTVRVVSIGDYSISPNQVTCISNLPAGLRIKRRAV